MSLVEFQTGLGRLLREQKSSDPLHGLNLDPNEQQYFAALPQTPGFRFCASIQRSWCIGRAARSAYFTLSLLPHEERDSLLNEWVDMGAGTSSFFEAEGESFLGFISKRLIDPSHELSVCQFEQATLRASNGASTFSSPEPAGLDDPGRKLRRGSHAALVRLYADPSLIIESLKTRAPLPPLSSEPTVLMFSPGLPELCHEPSTEEIAIWDALDAPAPVEDLLRSNTSAQTLAQLLKQGTIEYTD
jgi:hypothetical protein